MACLALHGIRLVVVATSTSASGRVVSNLQAAFSSPEASGRAFRILHHRDAEKGPSRISAIMVSFTCEQCQEVLKKNAVAKHYQGRCRGAASFTCIDCFKTFDRQSIVAHTSCTTGENSSTERDAARLKYLLRETAQAVIVPRRPGTFTVRIA